MVSPRVWPRSCQKAFPAYARVLHPVSAGKGKYITWATVAQQCGGIMHRLVQFHALSARSQVAVESPYPGNLPPHLLRALGAALAKHTGTPEDCYFCVWHGYGWEPESLSPVLRAALQSESRVKLPYRDYALLEGPLEAAAEVGWFLTPEHFVPQSPNLFWPRDHAWCVASEIDLFCTLVAGCNQLIEDLVADTRLETWLVFADDPTTADSDRKNT
jgi:hypothetical protein